MSIELLKRLEDLEQEKERIGELLIQKSTSKKNHIIANVESDFKSFFEGKGFEVTKINREYTASYGKLNAKLSSEPPDTNFFGVIFRFDLDLTSLNMNNEVIVLNRVQPGLSASNFKFSSSNTNEIESKIESAENDIKDYKLRLENFAEEKWSLFLKLDNPNPGYGYSDPYDNLLEILANLFK